MARWATGRGRRIVAGVLWISLLLFSALIFFVSSRPVPDELRLGLPGLDKVLHAGAYGFWASLFLGALSSTARGWGYRRLAAMTVLATALYGASDEIHQSFVPGRSADILDWAADLAGAALVVLSVAILRRKMRSAVE